jgi:hypothetical protein
MTLKDRNVTLKDRNVTLKDRNMTLTVPRQWRNAATGRHDALASCGAAVLRYRA